MSNKKELLDRFIVSFKKFIEELNGLKQSKTITGLLGQYSRVKGEKAEELIRRFKTKSEPFKDQILAEDLSFLENDNISILPKVHLQEYWEISDELMKDRITTYMELLYKFTMYYLEDEITSIKGNTLSVSSMFEAGGYNVEKPGLNTLAKKLGFNLNELTEQLNNITDDDIQEASEKVMGLMGSANDNTKEMMTNMIGTIGDVLKTKKLSGDNLFNDIMEISNQVVQKTQKNFDSGKVDPADFMKSASEMSTNLTREVTGQEISLEELTQQMKGMDMSNPEKTMEEIMKNMGK